MARDPEDQQQRHQAIDPGISVHVEAPAGSGKTTVLLKRYLALLATVQEPEEILALTFTRKAAGELRTRIQAEINKREAPGEVNSLPAHEAELRELALAAIRRHADKGAALLERLQVGTFHGFCAQLLKLAPHRAGLPPDFGLLEETATKRLQKEAVALLGQRLRMLPAGDPGRQALVRRLVRLNNNWPRLAAELQDLLARRDILGDFITLARESRDPAAYQSKLLEHLNVLIGPRLSRLAQEFSQAAIGRRWPELYQCLAASGSSLIDTLPAAVPGDGLEDLVSWRNVANGMLTTKGHCFRRFQQPKFPKNFKESSCCQLLQDLPEGLVEHLNFFREMSAILLPEDEVSAVQDLIILLHETLQTYEALCASRRSLDFVALEQIALRMLGAEDLPELLQRLDRRLDPLAGGRISGYQRQPDAPPVPAAGGLAGRPAAQPDGSGRPQTVHLRVAPGQAGFVFQVPGHGAFVGLSRVPGFYHPGLEDEFPVQRGPDRLGQRGFWRNHNGGPGGQRGGFQGGGRETRMPRPAARRTCPCLPDRRPAGWRQSGWPGNYCGWIRDSSRCPRRTERPWGCCFSPARICPFTWRPGAGRA